MRRNRIFKKNVNVNVTHKSIDCNSNLLNENRDHKLTNNRLDSEKC
jgi:hypothetical protein